MNRRLNVSVGPDRHRLDRRRLIPLFLELRRLSDRRVAIKLILFLRIQMILCLRRYRRLVLPPDVELWHLPRDHRQLRFLRRSTLTPPVRRVNLSKIPLEYPW